MASPQDPETFLKNLRNGLKASARLVTGTDPEKIHKPTGLYDLDLANTDQDLRLMTDRIMQARHPDFSICAYGVSGTGKSEYLLYLAHRMGFDTLVVPYSSLADAYVGNTEKNIRAAFERAADERKFLILDEADSLLSNRKDSVRSWERTAVNEMLTCMEKHEGPVGCTTNLMDQMDPASLRRFVFKICFKGLRPEQASKAYIAYFDHEPPAQTIFPQEIAPGDFANVKKQARILGTDQDPAWLITALKNECKQKKASGECRPIGFAGTSPAQKLTP